MQFKGPPDDKYFIAYHYPYTFSDLQKSLHRICRNPVNDYVIRKSSLCESLGGNECSLLTVTDFDPASFKSSPLINRKYVLLSGRVHPGESNSSHIVEGIFKYLIGDSENAKILRKKCIFKIVPMLNPDGVVNGSHRCSLAGVDLNRRWKRPSMTSNPTIFWTKLLWRFLIKLKGHPVVIQPNPVGV